MAGIQGDTTQVLLMQLRDLISQANNGKQCIGYETLSVTNSAVGRLVDIPENAQSMEITVECAGSTNANSAVRYTLDGSTPVTGAASSLGVPLGDFDTVEITNNTNLNNFRVIAVDAANTKYLKVQYFK